MRKRFLLPVLLMMTLALIQTGCGKDKKLETFKEDMNNFSAAVLEKGGQIDSIDVNSEDAVNEFLSLLDEINAEFTSLGNLEVPKQFENVEDLADDAASYMNEAVTLYHEAFESDVYDEDVELAARENYTRAMKRVSYIADILRGEIPEDANITIITEPDDEE